MSKVEEGNFSGNLSVFVVVVVIVVVYLFYFYFSMHYWEPWRKILK